MLVSAVQQSESAICMYIYIYIYLLPLDPASHPSKTVTEHQAEFPVLHSNFLLAIYFTHSKHSKLVSSDIGLFNTVITYL